MSHNAFELADIVVRYGGTLAVDSVSLSSVPGRLTALLGPNGAGKSSLLSVLSTAAKPESGTVRIFGSDVRTAPMRARAHLGLVFQERTLDKELTVEQNLWFHARLFGMRRTDAANQIDRLLAMLDLTDQRRTAIERLSGGTARRVELVRALLHRPGLLILDEPTTGLDPRSRRVVWRDLLRMRDELGVTTLYSTHYLDEAEYADEIVIMSGGRIGRSGSPVDLKDELHASCVQLRTYDDAVAAAQLRAAGFEVITGFTELEIRCAEPDRRVADIVRVLDLPVLSVTVHNPSMDDVYAAATMPTGRDIS
ncbi:ABC transporter ATP-binding protein [Nocardia colli]|uniref:ABC transporter ATP-binding protein n=1 Tax=Nocardia colli TaxID=2545717 RepID=A0A5N0EDZ7_9NOCA|nr:ABC transporter ATP-binding protein [Nocardia colli]KAA8886355.1 ABC transporter ATP-binding protein [Nocardia colli]